MTYSQRPNKKQLTFLLLMCLISSLILWIDVIYDIFPYQNRSLGKELFFPIVMSSFSIISILEILRLKKDRRIYHYIAYVLAIPLLPLFIIKTLSETKLLGSLTLPLIAFGIITVISTYFFKLVALFEISPAFNKNVIPYLNLTTIASIFIYSDKFIIKLLAKTIPDDQMPKVYKEVTFELIQKKPFQKMAYLLLTILFVIATIEKLGEFEFFHFLDPFKNVALQALITFAAIDRMVTKWKKI